MTWRERLWALTHRDAARLELRHEGAVMAISVHCGAAFRIGPKSLRSLACLLNETADQIENAPRRVADSVIFAQRMVPRQAVLEAVSPTRRSGRRTGGTRHGQDAEVPAADDRDQNQDQHTQAVGSGTASQFSGLSLASGRPR
jgi:hypothetical protein